MEIIDLVIVGGGPSGLACGIEAQKAGLRYVIMEKGTITDAIRRFPRSMTFFSTPELLELGGLPFTSTNTRPDRQEALQYYRRVVEYFRLEVRLRTRVLSIRREGAHFCVETNRGDIRARFVVIATGYFDFTNRLGVEGEDLDHVHSHYDEPWPYVHARVAVIGGRNSAVEAALDLYRHGATVHLIHRKPGLGDSVKYWIRPDIENRIRQKQIFAHFNTVVQAIRPEVLLLRKHETGQHSEIEVDFVVKLIGYRPDEDFLRSVGVALDNTTLVPDYDPETFETNVDGIYIAGSVACGCETWNIFIENGRAHAVPVIGHIRERLEMGRLPA